MKFLLSDDFESGYVFMIIESSNDTTIPLPVNTSIIPSMYTLRSARMTAPKRWKMYNINMSQKLHIPFTGTAWTSSSWPRATRRSTRPPASPRSISTTRPGGTSCCSRRMATSRSPSSQITRAPGWCTATSPGTPVLVSPPTIHGLCGNQMLTGVQTRPRHADPRA